VANNQLATTTVTIRKPSLEQCFIVLRFMVITLGNHCMSTWDATMPIKTVRLGYFPSTENASRTLPGMPPKVPYPELR